MICQPFKSGKGIGFCCHAPTRTRKCRMGCGRAASLLCDHEMRPGFTCDQPLCADCAVSKGPDVDWCPNHEEPTP